MQDLRVPGQAAWKLPGIGFTQFVFQSTISFYQQGAPTEEAPSFPERLGILPFPIDTAGATPVI